MSKWHCSSLNITNQIKECSLNLFYIRYILYFSLLYLLFTNLIKLLL